MEWQEAMLSAALLNLRAIEGLQGEA